MKKWLLNNKLTVIGAILGAIGGFLYYYFVGCASGTCGITSSPVNSTLYFAGATMNFKSIKLIKQN